MSIQVTEKTIRQFVAEVSDQHHAMAGAVISASAAQAVALGEACMQISLDNQVDRLDWTAVSTRIEEMGHIKDTLLVWCEQDAAAIADYVALRESGGGLADQRILCEGPAEISKLSLEAALLLQNFRSLAFEQVQDDLEIAITLLAGTARAAILLLDSNLRIWPEPDLLEEYEPILADLLNQIKQVTPVKQIRK